MRNPHKALIQLLKKLDHSELLAKIKSYVKIAGTQVVYAVLLLFFAYQRSDTPSWAKRIILGSIAYLLAPIDLVPDLTPFLGFTDDFGILMFGLASIAGYVNSDVRQRARNQVVQLFGQIDLSDLSEVDKKL